MSYLFTLTWVAAKPDINLDLKSKYGNFVSQLQTSLFNVECFKQKNIEYFILANAMICFIPEQS